MSRARAPKRQADAEPEPEAVLHLDLGGYEGPLHLLLALARSKKVDLSALSMVELSDQYLAHIQAAKAMRLEVAGDFLVMAAWLAYLKSRLLTPPEEADPDETPPEEAARRLAFRLQRLDAMRDAADRLFEGLVLDRDVFTRGAPEEAGSAETPEWEADLMDLLRAYGARRSRSAPPRYETPAPNVYALEEARASVFAALRESSEWRALDRLLPDDDAFPEPAPPRASRLASAFAAVLELTRDGRAELRQASAFEPIYLRRPDLETEAKPAGGE